MDQDSVVSGKSERGRVVVGRRQRSREERKIENNQGYSKESIPLRNYEDNLDDVTVITGATSEFNYSLEDLSNKNKNLSLNKTNSQKFSQRSCYKCVRILKSCFIIFVSIVCFLSPIAMVMLPRLPQLNWNLEICDVECESAMLGVALKLIFLSLATFALFFPLPNFYFPRSEKQRSVVVFVILFLIISYWLFYFLRLLLKPEVTYLGLISYASSFVDCLLFVHYLALILFFVLKMQKRYVVKVLRSPDGVSKSYLIGPMSIQSLSVYCLHKYYSEFQAYNPYLEMSSKGKLGGGGVGRGGGMAFKLYNIDGENGVEGGKGGGVKGAGKAYSVVSNNSVSEKRGHNERYLMELEQERRLMKRKIRLVSAAEEAFHHVRVMKNGITLGSLSCQSLSSHETAQAIFPTLVKPLQKYLKTTRQQPKHSMQEVLLHLQHCISYQLSHKAFLEKYLLQGEVLTGEFKSNDNSNNSSSSQSKDELHRWSLLSEKSSNKQIEEGIMFKLTRNNSLNSTLEAISLTECLLVTVKKLPFFDVVEDGGEFKNQRFTLDMNTELVC